MNQVIKENNIKHCLKLINAERDKLIFENGEEEGIKGIVWCTGYKPNFDWIDLHVFGEDKYPIQERGKVNKMQGLYFIGLRYQTKINSTLIGGVGKDAEYIVKDVITMNKNKKELKE
jgi:putative flavoprotein involved in K+ transport